MTSIAFRPHGDVKTYIDGRILITDVRGPWNEELVKIWVQQAYPLASQLQAGGPWAGLVLASGSMLTSHGAMELQRSAVVYSVEKQNLVVNAFVADANVEGRHFIENTYSYVYADLVPYRYFDHLSEAKSWVESYLATFQQAS